MKLKLILVISKKKSVIFCPISSKIYSEIMAICIEAFGAVVFLVAQYPFGWNQIW